MGVSVGVVCSVCFLIVGVLIGVLANITSHKCKKASHKGQSAAALPPPVYEEVESRGVARSKFTRKMSFSWRRTWHMDM